MYLKELETLYAELADNVCQIEKTVLTISDCQFKDNDFEISDFPIETNKDSAITDCGIDFLTNLKTQSVQSNAVSAIITTLPIAYEINAPQGAVAMATGEFL